jgi:hypothetical protein
VAPPKVVTDWKWVGRWFHDSLSTSIDFVVSLGLLCTGLFLMFFIRPVAKEGVWLVLPLIGAILFWFFTVPDMRFAPGYFWSLALLILSTAIHGLHKASVAMRKIVPIILFSVILIMVIPVRSYLYFGLPPFRKAFRNISEFLFVLPIPTSQTKTRFTSDGIPVHVTGEGQDCWFSELPCTYYLYEGLRIEKSPEGYFEKFYLP